MSASRHRVTPTAQDESVYRRYLEFGSLVQGGRVIPHWLPNDPCFWIAQGDPQDRTIVKVDPLANTATPMFDIAALRASLREDLGHEPPGVGVPFERFEFTTPGTVAFSLHGISYELNLEGYKLSRALPPSSFSYADLVRSEAERAHPATFMRWKLFGVGRRESSPTAVSPDAQWIAAIEHHNLVLRATVDGHTVQVTSDGHPVSFWDLDCAWSNPWSPDSVHLAVFRHDTHGMRRIPNIEWLKPWEQSREFIAMPAGGALHRSTLYLIDMYSHQLLKIDLGDHTDRHVRIIAWLPDGSELIVASYDRHFSRVDISAINALTRVVRTVLIENSNTFLITPHKALLSKDAGFHLLPDGSGFLWSSERNGWNHLYHYDIQGRLIRRLTEGDWPVHEVVRVDQTGGWVYFTANGDSSRPYDVHLYRIGLAGGHLSQVTQGHGIHSVQLAPSAKYFTDIYSSVDTPPRTVLREAGGRLIRTLGEADTRRLHAVGWVPPKEYVVKAADGVTDLWVTMYFPYNFDSTHRYPVVEYIYGGPQRIERTLDFGDEPKIPSLARAENFNKALAQLGFLVLTLDARGTPGRSKAFHDVVYRNFGRFEIADHAAALRQLGARLDFLDLERVGIWGSSWGGQFAFRALTQAPDLYKVGISEMPALDPRRLMLYEPFLGMPQENKLGYDAADPFRLAGNLTGELLLIGGMNDPYSQADLLKLSEALIRLGKQHQIMIYPNCGHLIAGKNAEYNMELKRRFFLDRLMNANAGEAP